ncbi:hypothetical protein Pla123a_14730 [Posidoniimonas polymericola]|uniref:Uncharacterized protein n=1 Tax=Posidoniimonas polymericola TaxID=2528002 RepID=A0A5C5YSQ8_9BACT|nr:hypothetical protein [Posidoniimonas polymericola]TWT77677.1 hypothetical protein Pla123a_14730 [Posidoniimonas polymericola]
MKSRSMMVGLAGAVVLAAALMSLDAGAEEAKPPVDPGKFKDKVTLFYLHGSFDGGSVMIRDARFEQVHDRWFVTGTSPDAGDPDDWARDSEAGIDWQRVESFYVFTEEQFQQQVFEGPGAI